MLCSSKLVLIYSVLYVILQLSQIAQLSAEHKFQCYTFKAFSVTIWLTHLP